MWLTRLAIRNPVAITVFYVLIVIVGLLALSRMGRSILPPISSPVVSVSAVYPGAGPEELERLAIEPMEDEIKGLPDISRVSSSAQNGIAEIVVQFQFGSNVDTDRENVQQAVDAARANMPPDLVPPIVSKDDPTQAPVLEESVSSVLVSPTELAQILNDKIVPALRATGGVGTVQSSGSVVPQFIVNPKRGALDAVGGTPLDIFRAVASGNDLLPGGELRSAVSQSSIGIDASVLTVPAIESLPVTIPRAGTPPLGDLASVTDGYADRSVIARVDGDESALVFVAARSGADSLGTIRAARKTFLRLAAEYPKIRFEELRTDGPYTNAAIAGVLQTLGEGIVLTVLVMLVFLHAWRNALVAAISIPTSLFAAFVTMWFMGFTLNVLSLMGLSLTIGILVDDSIVIIEAIARAVSRGLTGDAAALAGRKDLGGAAFAITLVDVAVFTPIGLMSGIVGEFMREFALVIVFATAFSLLVSFTLTPLLTARWALTGAGEAFDGLSFGEVLARLRSRARLFPWTLRSEFVLKPIAGWHALVNGFNAWEARTSFRYATAWLPAAMRRRRLVFIIAAAACVVSLIPVFMGAVPAEFSPPVNRGELTFDLTLPAGTPLAATDAATQRLTAALLEDPEVGHVETSSGRSFNGSADIFSSNVAQIGIVLSNPASNDGEVERRVRSLASLVPQGTLSGAGKGMGGTPAVSYSVGGDPQKIDAAAAKIANVLTANPFAADVRTSDLGVQPRIRIGVDREKARLLNLSVDDIAQTIRIASGGSIATKARLPSGLANVVVQSDAAKDGDLNGLTRYTVRSADGNLVPLADVVTIQRATEPAVIEREDGERIVSVSANAANNVPISLLTSSVSHVVRDPNFLPPGTHIQPRGDIEQFLDTVSRMLAALGLSIIAVYAVLAVLYRSYTLPLVIMLTVPLASIGAFGGLFLLNAARIVFPNMPFLQNQTLNLYSMLGIIMLVGLVAKNGILLVEYAERAVRDEGKAAVEAIAAAAQTRFRPILMTTFAMIAGMVPLALGDTIGAEYRKALGTVVIGGLSTSLLLTLFIVPLVYLAYCERRSKTTRRRVALRTDVAHEVA